MREREDGGGTKGRDASERNREGVGRIEADNNNNKK